MSSHFPLLEYSSTRSVSPESTNKHPNLTLTAPSRNASSRTRGHPIISRLQADSESDLKAWLALNPLMPFPLLCLPTSIILQILTCLDLPDLDSLRLTGNQVLGALTADSVLHKQRLRTVGSTCLEPHLLNRPNRLDLAKTRKIKGLNMESKIIRGSYLHSPTSIKTFENSQRVNQLIIRTKLSKALSARPILLHLTSSNLMDEELRTVSPALAPTIRLLKRERAKDRLAQQMRHCHIFRAPLSFQFENRKPFDGAHHGHQFN